MSPHAPGLFGAQQQSLQFPPIHPPADPAPPDSSAVDDVIDLLCSLPPVDVGGRGEVPASAASAAGVHPPHQTHTSSHTEANPTEYVDVFTKKGIESAIAQASLLEKELKERQLHELHLLAARGAIRPLSYIDAGYTTKIASIVRRQPNFQEVVDGAVRPAMAIRAAGGHARQAPLLLVGPPGTGKTHFARSLARMLRVPFGTVDMSTASSSAGLCGLSTKWGNGSPGLLFRLLAHGADDEPRADPVLLVDELDKAMGSSRQHMDPVGSLYALLESSTAARFQDESLPSLLIDAQHVRWILCCNTLESIPDALLSRCLVFEIKELTTEQKRDIYRLVFVQTVSDCRLQAFDANLPPHILDTCLDLGTREFKNMCQIAIGRAVTHGRCEVVLEDFRSIKLASPTRMGFIR